VRLWSQKLTNGSEVSDKYLIFMDYVTNQVVEYICSDCKKSQKMKYRRTRYNGWRCKSCKLKALHKSGHYDGKIGLNKLSEEDKDKLSKITSDRWKNKEYRRKWKESRNKTKEKRSKISKEIWSDQNRKDKLSELLKERWKDPEYRKLKSEQSKKLWNDKDYRSKTRFNRGKISGLQETFYSILDDLGYVASDRSAEKHYFREYENKPDDIECSVGNKGPYSVDCVIPKSDGTYLAIDINGEWPHSQPNRVKIDDAKMSYMRSYLSDQYDYRVIWEVDFLSKNKLVDTLKEWLGINDIKISEFSFSDIEIKKCVASEYRILLGKYHYLSTGTRGGISYGAYLDNKLTAVCMFSPLSRQNILIPKEYNRNQCRELSRFCIDPRYQKKNFGSWFISRCIKLLHRNIKFIISYADTTFDHDGSVYKASNFKLDKEVPPDYWYMRQDGWVLHKRTVYGHAVRMSMKESEYAEKHYLRKVYGNKKLRFVYNR